MREYLVSVDQHLLLTGSSGSESTLQVFQVAVSASLRSTQRCAVFFGEPNDARTTFEAANLSGVAIFVISDQIGRASVVPNANIGAGDELLSVVSAAVAVVKATAAWDESALFVISIGQTEFRVQVSLWRNEW